MEHLLRGKPLCYESVEQWQGWLRHAKASDTSDTFTYCTDCTPAYRDFMKAEHRCQWPGTFFLRVTGGGLVGRRKGAPAFAGVV